MTSATKGAKPVARIEQGDTSRGTAPAKRPPAVASKAKAVEKPAAKPVKTASTSRRSG
jgi:hypothetical protein